MGGNCRGRKNFPKIRVVPNWDGLTRRKKGCPSIGAFEKKIGWPLFILDAVERITFQVQVG